MNERSFEGEITRGAKLIEAAVTVGAPQFVRTSVAGAGQHTEAPGWADSRWVATERYFAAETGIQVRVRSARSTHRTLLGQPAPQYAQDFGTALTRFADRAEASLGSAD